jgi:hypothetical protein
VADRDGGQSEAAAFAPPKRRPRPAGRLPPPARSGLRAEKRQRAAAVQGGVTGRQAVSGSLISYLSLYALLKGMVFPEPVLFKGALATAGWKAHGLRQPAAAFARPACWPADAGKHHGLPSLDAPPARFWHPSGMRGLNGSGSGGRRGAPTSGDDLGSLRDGERWRIGMADNQRQPLLRHRSGGHVRPAACHRLPAAGCGRKSGSGLPQSRVGSPVIRLFLEAS